MTKESDKSIRLIDYKALIAKLPVKEHATEIQPDAYDAWKKICGKYRFAGLLPEVRNGRQSLWISRGHIQTMPHETERDLKQFVLCVLLWGYGSPSGMRGLNAEKCLENMKGLTDFIKKERVDEKSIDDWWTHWTKFRKDGGIAGIGLSTYTKLLYFLQAKVNSHPAVILDARIKKVIKSGNIRELSDLKGKAALERFYPDYLDIISTCREDLDCTVDQIEMFLFMFGNSLEPRAT